MYYGSGTYAYKAGSLITGSNKMPCYREDDRAMRPIYVSSENFREFPTTPTATIPEIFNGLLFRSIL